MSISPNVPSFAGVLSLRIPPELPRWISCFYIIRNCLFASARRRRAFFSRTVPRPSSPRISTDARRRTNTTLRRANSIQANTRLAELKSIVEVTQGRKSA